MLKYLLFVAAIFIAAGGSFGQKVVFGKVNDGITNEPLPYVNVFVNNTTYGTVTNLNGEYNFVVPSGELEVIFSFVGYQSHKETIWVTDSSKLGIDIKLLPLTRELSTVTVSDHIDKEWRRLIKQYKKIFLGVTDAAQHCTIGNEWCIDVKKERISGKPVLVASASEPLQIENLALGYRVYYDLQNFYSSKENDTFNGYVYFVELNPKDSVEAERWARNRKNVYLGSDRHLFRSILLGTTREEGFTLFSYSTSGGQTQRLEYLPSHSLDPNTRRHRIPMEGRIEILYEMSNASHILRSSIKSNNGFIEVDAEGGVLNPADFIRTGYIGAHRVANLLPDNYKISPFIKGDSSEKFIPEFTSATSVFDSLKNQGINYLENHPNEKVYLHFDKTSYFKGEDSWYKAYVVDSDLNATSISSVLYVDWIDASGKVISHKRLKIETGSAVGDFAIDTTLQAGIYSVRAYTNWMRNDDHQLFFSRQIQIIDAISPEAVVVKPKKHLPMDLQFFPEGGTLIAGIKTIIAYKAIDANGKGLEVSGQIVDDQNKLVTSFKSSHMGMGTFPFIGDLHKSFRAILESGEVFDLPAPAGSGISMAASNMDPDDVLLRIETYNNDESEVYLIGQSRGSICYAQIISMNNNVKEISIARESLPEGTLQFTLFNNKGVPQCERRVFIKKSGQIAVSLTGYKEHYLPRDSIMLNVMVVSPDQSPLQTSLSVSITEADFNNTLHNSENIYTRLLLQSDLKGYIENPGWYFESQTPDRTYALDLVLLTHGWSRYNWDKLPRPEVEPSYSPEKGVTLSGRILSNKRPILNAPFIFMIEDSAQNNVGIYETDSAGRFKIADLDFSDTTAVSWRVMKKKGSYMNPRIELAKDADLPSTIPYQNGYPIPTGGPMPWNQKILERYIATGVWNFGASKMLDEVVVKAKRINVVSVGRNQEVVVPSPADLLTVTGEFVNRYAPGISSAKLIRISEDQEIWATSSGGRIIVSIDGYIRSPFDFPINPVLQLNTLAVDEIEYVLVSGDHFNGYFISVKTKHPSQLEVPGTIKQIVRGYDIAREFYHPKYGPADVSTIGPDNRITLYWNSNLSTTEDGTATIKFYNNDFTENFQIVVEGIADGNPFSLVRTIGGETKE